CGERVVGHAAVDVGGGEADVVLAVAGPVDPDMALRWPAADTADHGGVRVHAVRHGPGNRAAFRLLGGAGDGVAPEVGPVRVGGCGVALDGLGQPGVVTVAAPLPGEVVAGPAVHLPGAVQRPR